MAMMILGFLQLVTFVFWENYWPRPLMPLHIWKDSNFTLVSLPPEAKKPNPLKPMAHMLQPILTTIPGMMPFSSNFWLALLLQEVHSLDAPERGGVNAAAGHCRYHLEYRCCQYPPLGK